MNALHVKLDRPTDNDLARVIEPLASYICATNRPRAALRSALKVLFNEVRQTNRVALEVATAFGGSH